MGIEDYASRLKPYAKIEFVVLPEGHSGSARPDEHKTRTIEAASLVKGLPVDSFVIALDEKGKNLGSSEFATKLETEASSGRPIVFMIGGSWGLDQSVRDRADLVLSFGKQTLPHSLARIVLLEQLYRAETIMRKKEYHK